MSVKTNPVPYILKAFDGQATKRRVLVPRTNLGIDYRSKQSHSFQVSVKLARQLIRDNQLYLADI